jgi:predicted DNA-binding protein (MmcQ/YjbR family)
MASLKHPDATKLRAAAMKYPETVEDFPWGERAFKVAGKKVFLFLFERDDGGFNCSMKLPFRNDEALTLKGAERTGYGLGRAGWVTFSFGAKAKSPIAKLVDYLDESWRAVAPRKLSAAHAPPAAKKRKN